jgi:hypothetical protein
MQFAMKMQETEGPSEFEKVVARLGLKEQAWVTSERLKRWASLNRSRRYVPESLLKAWNLEVHLGRGTRD